MEEHPKHHQEHNHHQHMVADFRERFIVSIIIAIPVLLLSPLIQTFLRLENIIRFPGDSYVLFGLSTIIFFYGGWPFLKGLYNELRSKQPVMMTLIGLAIPLVVAVSTAISAKNGLLIRDRAAFERARNIDAIIFDKTGTLTKGEFGVTDTLSFSKEINESGLLKYASSLEAQSSHPIAKAIAKATDDRLEVNKFKSITGKGVEGIINGKDIKIVSPAVGAALMSLSTVIVAINARFLRVSK